MSVLQKIKRPQGPFTFDYESSETDHRGHWLCLPRGSDWAAPHDTGVLPFDAIVLLVTGSPMVTWWCDDPADRRIEIDVSLPPVKTDGGWSFIDLELDVIRHSDGSLVVADEDEFADACHAGHITDAEASLAQKACTDAKARLEVGHEPFNREGWLRLEKLRSRQP